MAFDRTERFVKSRTSTSAYVGPGSYDISELSKPPRDPDNAYPFLNGTSRQTVGIPKDVHKFPGPGSYNIEAPRKHIPSGVSHDYTDVRFKEKVHEGPSPAEYTLPDDLFKETPRKIRSHSGTWRGPAGKLWLIRPPRSTITSGPAVPSKRDVYGYDYNEHGILVKNPVIKLEPTDFYDIPRGETNFTTLKYKGNFWSRMKGRDDERTSVTPGPGDYEHETKKSLAQIRAEKTRETKRGAAKQPRFLEALCQQKLRQNFPAPNCYGPPRSVFDRYQRIRCKCNPYMVAPPPFNQTTQRFEHGFQSETPGPGTYEIVNRLFCFGSILNAPFGSFDTRFQKLEVMTTPGPADYHTDVGNIAFESVKRYKGRKRKPITYLDVHKTPTSINDDDKSTLTDKYSVMDEEKSAVHHAVFKSRVDRFPKICKDDIPDPGAYEALSAFKANRDRCDFLCRRLAPPFGSRASRSTMISKDVDFHVLCTDRFAGPSHYDLRGDISKNVKSGVICSAPRERKEDIKGPSPAHYHINPYITSSVLKKSFNVTLGKARSANDINEIQRPWRYRRSKKVLRWFAAPLKMHQHCI
ncbi:sperm-tail PG-rich repeat-containing protein 2-like isoform X2 [Pseudomyrmex gracilis]|uniref:sperm-tail PG-rich repeat-containing protein 2-like isoform X2 n=1 Tax=Pseudomyrmex gracilis TaxID=219809 RepID=UPI0009952288|nr:sperm-tail PG-rich repeat-containing protein 2-like isoform X2 [Pseudomyrmex gracilis]